MGPLNAHDSTTSMDKTDEIFLRYMLWDELYIFFSGIYSEISIGLSPLPVTVTNGIITFLVGDPYKPSFATVTGRGDNPRYQKYNAEVVS